MNRKRQRLRQRQRQRQREKKKWRAQISNTVHRIAARNSEPVAHSHLWEHVPRASIVYDSRLSNKNSLWRRRMFDISFNNIHHFFHSFSAIGPTNRYAAPLIWMHEQAMTWDEEKTKNAEPKNYTIYAKYLRVANIQRRRATPINSSIEQCDNGAYCRKNAFHVVAAGAAAVPHDDLWVYQPDGRSIGPALEPNRLHTSKE